VGVFGWIKRIWVGILTPSRRWSVGTLLTGGFVAGIAVVAAANTGLQATQTDQFCAYACHSMKTHVAPEWEASAHFTNRAGVRAGCADCHLAQQFIPKMQRKIRAAWTDVPGEIFGWIDTPEKFEARRLHMAEVVWAEMKANDSRECRSCHERAFMDFAAQSGRAREAHEDASKSGETCIDCHKGIAHRKPDMPAEEGESEDFSL
jgi:cytochrome c-type protein NapC